MAPFLLCSSLNRGKTMKSVIRTFVVLSLIGSGLGCAGGSKTVEVLPVEGATGAAASPDSGTTPTSSKGSDEIVAPKSETPPAPVVSSDPSTPPALPPPAKAPDPIIISLAPGVISPKEPLLPDVVTDVDVLNGPMDTLSNLDTPEAAGNSEGDVRTFRCGDNTVITGFEYAREDIDTGCGEGDTSGCGPEIHMAALKLTCSPLTITGTSNDSSSSASVWPTTQTAAGKADATINSDPSATNCKASVGVATGIFGRVDSELKSFGLSCGHFHAWKEGVAILPTYNKTASAEDWGGDEYAASPGWDGAPFEKSCDTNQAMVGLSIKMSGTRVLGITNALCADVKPAKMKLIFPTIGE